MAFNQAGGLVKGVANGRAAEFEAALFQVCAHGSGFGAGGANIGISAGAVDDRLAAHRSARLTVFLEQTRQNPKCIY